MTAALQITEPSLDDLAKRIRQENAAVIETARRSLQHALNVGDLLIVAKERVAHGEWPDWIKKNCAFSERTAQAYTRIAKNRGVIEAKAQHAADLSLRQALDIIKRAKVPETRLIPAYASGGWELPPPVDAEPTDAPQDNVVPLAVSAPTDDDDEPRPPRLNAIGKPLSPNFDPNYKVPASSRSPNALRKPHSRDEFITDEREAQLIEEQGLTPLWAKEKPEAIAARLAKYFTVEQIAKICAIAIDLKKAAQATLAAEPPRAA